MNRKACPSDVGDEEWAFVALYLTLMTEDAPQRDYPLREVFNGLRYIVRGSIPWRMMPNSSSRRPRWVRGSSPASCSAGVAALGFWKILPWLRLTDSDQLTTITFLLRLTSNRTGTGAGESGSPVAVPH